MKQQFLVNSFTFLLFFFLLFAYTKLAGPIPFAVDNITTTKTDNFSVSGEGTVTASPDEAIINAGIQTQAATVQDAQNKINTVINDVSANIKKLGINGADIQSSNYNIQPSYDYSGGTQKITGYQASTTLNIKVKDISKINNVIDTATKNGANQISNISFDISDKTALENQARAKAVAQAKQIAQQAAQMGGFRLGKLINYSEQIGNTPQPIPLAAKAVSVNGGGTPTNIEPGSTDIKVTVTLSYEVQ